MAPKTEQKIYVGIGLDFETGGLDCRECACTQIALQAVRFDTWQVFDRYQAYIAPYGKQDAGLPRRKVLRTRHEQAKEPEYVPMKYEQTALDYSAITMEMLRTQGVDMKKSPEMSSPSPNAAPSRRAISASPCWSDRTSLSISDSCNS